MIRALRSLIWRHLQREWHRGSWWLPVVFFIIVATLYPFAVGADAALLARTGGAIVWIAALLAAMLPVERLFAADVADGTIDQLALRGISDEVIALATMAAHAISFGVPLLLSILPAAALLALNGATIANLVTGLAIALPAFAAIGTMVSAVTLGARGGGALAGLLMLPLAVPLVIFGAGSMQLAGQAAGGGALPMLAATALLLVAMAPFAAGAALRGVRSA